MVDQFLSMKLEEKRQQYKCGSKYVTLSQIPVWSVKSNKPSAVSNGEIAGSKVSVFVGDITTLEIDAIVNAANGKLAGGGGVDGFIHRAAGAEDLQAECQTLNGCETGSCKITGGYRLPAKYIIHCVGPVGEKPGPLASCYESAMNLLVANNLRSIAFPCISTGVYGYPNESAAKVALNAIQTWLNDPNNRDKIDRIIFCLFLEKDVEIYNRLLNQYFPD
ncbi:hypothetical protein RDWZM_008183 [Blomia tropicalis]|uniref:Macro domain-containing protein n=1 Tax=Blomia tropicalis TaxID=40697 RepID=A0A9Q0RJU2_BLOTA|nr:hypothetical protein RDWZM_008183 [Blomia tropicalis]